MTRRGFALAALLVLTLALLLPSVGTAETQDVPPIVIGPITLSAGVGNAGGGQPGTSDCAPVSALTGVDVTMGASLTTARSSCTELAIAAGSGDVAPIGPVFKGAWIAGTPPVSPGPASTCPAGTVVVGYYSRSGLLVDGVQMICRTLSGSVPAGPEVVGAYVGGMGGQQNPPVYCPSNQVAVGIAGRAGNSLDYFRLQCASLSVDHVLFLPLIVSGG